MNFDNIELQNKERPTDAAIKKWELKIEDLLSAHELKVSLIIRDTPREWWEGFKSPEREWRSHYLDWIEGVKISNQEVDSLVVPLYTKHYVTENEEHAITWHDAYEIQNCLYTHLNKTTGNRDDKYWLLWDKLNLN